jgi:hypothetical protein
MAEKTLGVSRENLATLQQAIRDWSVAHVGPVPAPANNHN